MREPLQLPQCSPPSFCQQQSAVAPIHSLPHPVCCPAQMNLADSERMAGVLESVGYECAEDPSAADVLIYNTCSIREKAEVKVYSALGRQVRAHTRAAAAAASSSDHATAACALLPRRLAEGSCSCIAAPGHAPAPLLWLPRLIHTLHCLSTHCCRQSASVTAWAR